jgi:arylsulfatase A-like enzyme
MTRHEGSLITCRPIFISFMAGLALSEGCNAPPQGAASILAPSKSRSRAEGAVPKPNVLLITLDTLRYDQTGIGDDSTNQTPFLRKLAKEGVEFTNSYSTYDSTPESHYSIMTGYTVVAADGDRPDHSVSYQLQKLGYKTFGIAANGNLSQKSNPCLSGFRRYTCLYDEWEAMSPAQKAAHSATIDRLLGRYGAPVNDFNRAKLYVGADLVIKRFAEESASATGPFFGFLNLMDAHDPYLPDPARYEADLQEKGIRPADFASDLRTRALPPQTVDPSRLSEPKTRDLVQATLAKAQQRKWQATFDLGPASLATYKKRYRAQVRELDDAVRRIFDILAERKLLESTIVIITSDHGESFGEQHLITHSFLNTGDREATHRVPLIIVFPARYGFRARSLSIPTTSADIAPTIFDIAGIDWLPISNAALPGKYGKSLYPYLTANLVMYSGIRPAAAERTLNNQQREESQRNAEARLRALGYVR